MNDLYSIETEAYVIASQWGWELTELDPAKQYMIKQIIRLKIRQKDSDIKIASIMMQQYTAGIRNVVKNMYCISVERNQIWVLMQRLLDCEITGIQQLHNFI